MVLEIIKDLGMRRDKNGVTRRWCQAKCSYCGTVSEHRTQSLKVKKSCGCATHLKACIKHGMSNTRQYTIWADMKDRCDNPKNKSYIRYGKRGITYDTNWKTFEGFWKDMSTTYFKEGTIERIDNTKGYSADNCKWATIEEQAKNRNSINTFKQRDENSYIRKITIKDIAIFGEQYKIAKYGDGKHIVQNMVNTLDISINTAKIYLSKYKKGTLCKLV